MNTRSNKQKGRKGQQDVAKLILEMFNGLSPDDVRSTPMGTQGADIMLSPAAQKIIPWDIEVKRGKAINMIRACQQAQNRSTHEPVAVARYDREKTWYACVEFEYLLKLIKALTKG